MPTTTSVVQMGELLKQMVEKQASDLHLGVGYSPTLRIDGTLVSLEYAPLTHEGISDLLQQILSKEQIAAFLKNQECDMAFGIEGLGRFRVNCFFQRGKMAVAIRLIPSKIRSFEECGLPADVMNYFCNRPKGLVLVTGATGSGKSTTLASMVEKINQTHACHIVTIEDPIEYIHQNKKAIVDQREVGQDTHSFTEALKHILRQDPNVILIGEMRDCETMDVALMAAETGHLVLATLHTSDSTQSINRIIDVFPAHQQQQVRIQLSMVLQGVLSQQLIPRCDGPGRVLALEILITTHAVRSLIRDAKVHQIFSAIQTGQKEGMKTMNQSLCELYTRKMISLEEALGRTTEVEDLKRLITGK